MTKCFDKTALPSIWMFWPQVHCYGFGYPLRRWTNFVIINVNHISNSFSLLRIHDIDLTFKATKAFVQYVSALTTLSQGIKTFQYADKGGGVVFQFNSSKRGTFLFGKFFLSFSNWRNIHNDCSWSKEILGAEFRQTRNCSQSEGIYSRQSLSEQVCFTLLFSTPKKTDMFTLYNLILCLSTQEIIHNLWGSIWSQGSFTQPHFTFNFINFLFYCFS